MKESTFDLIAAARVSRRVNLETIRLTEVIFTLEKEGSGELELTLCHPVVGDPKPPENGRVTVHCNYTFSFEHEGVLACSLSLAYSILYSLTGTEPTDPNDLGHFANANGRYHTWPFAREMVTSLTAKAGYAAYVLPVLSFSPKVEKTDEEAEPEAEVEEVPELEEDEAPASSEDS